MMDNTMFKANMENVANNTTVKCSMPTPGPGLHDLLASLGELAKENGSLSYQIRENLFGSVPTEGSSNENANGCAIDALIDANERLAEANDILRSVRDRL